MNPPESVLPMTAMLTVGMRALMAWFAVVTSYPRRIAEATAQKHKSLKASPTEVVAIVIGADAGDVAISSPPDWSVARKPPLTDVGLSLESEDWLTSLILYWISNPEVVSNPQKAFG